MEMCERGRDVLLDSDGNQLMLLVAGYLGCLGDVVCDVLRWLESRDWCWTY